MNNESHISIFVRDMRVNVRIGLEDFEREAPQPVDVSVELFTSVDYLSGVDAGSIIDYAKIHEVVKGWENRAHVELIETYLKELIALGFSFEAVTALRASIRKPDIFENANAAGLEAFIRREDFTAPKPQPWP